MRGRKLLAFGSGAVAVGIIVAVRIQRRLLQTEEGLGLVSEVDSVLTRIEEHMGVMFHELVRYHEAIMDARGDISEVLEGLRATREEMAGLNDEVRSYMASQHLGERVTRRPLTPDETTRNHPRSREIIVVSSGSHR